MKNVAGITVGEESDINTSYDLFNNSLAQIYDESFPVREKIYKVNDNKYNPWITTAILNSVKEKNRLYKKYIQMKTLDSKVAYCNYNNKLTTLIRCSEKSIMLKNLII